MLGFAADNLNIRFKVVPFDEMYGPEASRALVNKKLKEAAISNNWVFSNQHPGKLVVRDGRTGQNFQNPIRNSIFKSAHGASSIASKPAPAIRSAK